MEENNKLIKRQLTISTINMILLIVVLAVLVGVCVYVFKTISHMEATVKMISEEVTPIIDKVDKIDVDKLNDLVGKLDGVMETFSNFGNILG